MVQKPQCKFSGRFNVPGGGVGFFDYSLIAFELVPKLPERCFVRLGLFQGDRFSLGHGEGWSVRASWSLSNIELGRVAEVSSEIGKHCSFKLSCQVVGTVEFHGEFPCVSDGFCRLPWCTGTVESSQRVSLCGRCLLLFVCGYGYTKPEDCGCEVIPSSL